MFQKLKAFRNLRSAAKSLQQELANETIDLERNGIRIALDGNLDVRSLTLPPTMSHEELQRRLPEVLNQAIDKAQRVGAEKIRARGGLAGLGLK